jgi:cytosine/adenosine deaminase-related metal-dependent hydrolase
MSTNHEIEALCGMITNAAHAMNVGNSANLVLLSALNVLEALREHAAPLQVISHGKLIDRARMDYLARTGEW